VDELPGTCGSLAGHWLRAASEVLGTWEFAREIAWVGERHTGYHLIPPSLGKTA